MGRMNTQQYDFMIKKYRIEYNQYVAIQQQNTEHLTFKEWLKAFKNITLVNYEHTTN